MIDSCALKVSTEEKLLVLPGPGMKQLSKSAFMARLRPMNYEVDENQSSNDINRLNRISYKARSIRIKEIDTKKSFARFTARRDLNFRLLQAMRRDCFVFHGGRILGL